MTSKPKTAIVVDPYSSGNMLAPELRRVGVTPVAVISTGEPLAAYAASFRPGDFETIVAFDGDLDALVRQLATKAPLWVLPGTESGVELADRLAAALTPERANDPELSSARRDKGWMAQAVRAAGLSILRQHAASNIDDVIAWLTKERLLEHDLVLKPPRSAGTDSVTRVPAGQDWTHTFRALLGQRNKLGVVNDRVLVQEYVTGTEYVVDTYSHDGVHTVTDLCRYGKFDNGGHMAVYDSLEFLPYDPEAYGALFDYTRGVLTALGIRNGAGHTEVMLTAEGPRLIETGARMHGGGHPRFCRLATGDSQLDRTIRHLLGEIVPGPGYTLKRTVLVVFLVARTSGTVKNIEIYDRVKSLSSHHDSIVGTRNGDRVEATRDLFASLGLGFVVFAHERRDQVWEDYATLRAIERQLVIEPASPP
ncbi:ATP-grasp domain-containing protein [Pendulispora albinea]|uniref:ATP-grasp domain-containing protein n=1 Tax=Pendulispora albinea TaxID=2741071 RepID=A0ABZ2LRK6_9BACT